MQTHTLSYNMALQFNQCFIHIREDSGMEAMAEHPGIPVTEGGGPSLPYIAWTASVWATHADGSMGRTGSWRGAIG